MDGYHGGADALPLPDAYAAEEGPPPEVIAGQAQRQPHAEPFTMPANVCWKPSISVPAGLGDDGLPLGLFITVRRHHDDVVLRLTPRYDG